ncbi:MAG TPA: chorismate-binding protein, partial [Polyangiaceae bacterium]|nr:chorismate-binding protein [Polyangiaceae bacterium]
MVVSQRLAVSADAFAVARLLADGEALALVCADRGRTVYVACAPSDVSNALDPEPELARRAAQFGEIPRWIGVLPYEARRELERSGRAEVRPAPELLTPLWRRYGCVVKITRDIEVIGDDARVVAELTERLTHGLNAGAPARRPLAVSLRQKPERGAAHAERIRRALEYVRSGDIYQVNLARRFELFVEGSALELLASLAVGILPPHALSLDWPELGVAMASPELFLQLDADGHVATRPIKGTRPRSSDPALDRELARALELDPKERAELAMIIDVERNDLGRLAVPGSVRLTEPPCVEAHAEVHHRAATVTAALRPGVSRQELLAAMLPSGSVTGAPKIRAMEIIAELEPARRGLYTGAGGFVRRDGGLELGMA